MTNPDLTEALDRILKEVWYHGNRNDTPSDLDTIGGNPDEAKAEILQLITRSKIEARLDELDNVLNITSDGGKYETDIVSGHLLKERISTLQSKLKERK